MVTVNAFVKLALSFQDAVELPHFHLRSFRRSGKIFATLWEKENKVMIKLPLVEQSVFCSYDKITFSPVPGAWGRKGATFVQLSTVRKDMLLDALSVAYKSLSKPSPASKVKKKP